MEANATLDYGALQVELRAENAADLESELSQIITFLESNEDRINGIFGDISPPNVDDSEHGNGDSDDDSRLQNGDREGPLAALARNLRTDEELLEDFILTDDELPQLYVEDIRVIGNNKTDRQRNASLILLYIWDECYDVERVKTSDLKNALSMSGISESNLANMYQGQGDRFFDRSGRGASATIGLTTPGKRRAKKELSGIVETFEVQRSDSGQTTADDFR